jgi:hypothetical protein
MYLAKKDKDFLKLSRFSAEMTKRSYKQHGYYNIEISHYPNEAPFEAVYRLCHQLYRLLNTQIYWYKLANAYYITTKPDIEYYLVNNPKLNDPAYADL